MEEQLKAVLAEKLKKEHEKSLEADRTETQIKQVKATIDDQISKAVK